MRLRIILLAALALAALGVAPGIAAAATTPSATTTGSQPASWSMDFSLPSAGKSGCMVCHGDEDLMRIENGEPVSLYVSSSDLASSPHADTPCTGCHVDFTYKAPHTGTTDADWKATAKAACKNCHKSEFGDYAASSHSPAAAKGTQPKEAKSNADTDAVEPLCGDCHPGHTMEILKDNPAGQAALHARGEEMCGQCHEQFTTTYADYYHGKAYDMSAEDAPACWDCHTGHLVLPADNRDSSVNEANLGDTCAECHDDPGDDYTSAYSGLIHGQEAALADNPAYSLFDRARDAVSSAFEQVWSIFR